MLLWISTVAIIFFVAVVIGAGPTARNGNSPYPLFLIALVAMGLALGSTYLNYRVEDARYEHDRQARETLEQTTTARVLGQLEDAYGVTFLDERQSLPLVAGTGADADLRLPDGGEQTCDLGGYDGTYSIRCGEGFWDDEVPLPVVEGWTGPPS
ncbi:hypothetical protein [Cellulomonas sp. URHB0016]